MAQNDFKLGNFTGLVPCWIDAPSTSQPAHRYHGMNAVAIKEDNGFRVCFVDEPTPRTLHLPEGTHLVSGWKPRGSSKSTSNTWQATIKEKNKDNPITSTYTFSFESFGFIEDPRQREYEERKYLVNFWGLNNPDVEWYYLERI